MSKLYKNWFVHNLVSHPLMQIVFMVVRPFSLNLASRWADAIHSVTAPPETPWYDGLNHDDMVANMLDEWEKDAPKLVHGDYDSDRNYAIAELWVKAHYDEVPSEVWAKFLSSADKLIRMNHRLAVVGTDDDPNSYWG